MEIESLAVLATAYEICGIVDYEKLFIDEFVRNSIDTMTIDDVIELYNDYQYYIGNFDNVIYHFDCDFFNENFETPYEAARASFFGEVHWSDDYIRFNGYGNLESLSDTKVYEEVRYDDEFLLYVLQERNIVEEYKDDVFMGELEAETERLLALGY